jgi:hypothetical protein
MPLLGNYPKNMLAKIQKDLCTKLFIAKTGMTQISTNKEPIE